MTGQTPSHPRPRALLISHAVPDPLGGPRRARAWQLLRLASRSHDVSLLCVSDGPIHLDRWRWLRYTAARVELLPPARRYALAAAALRPLAAHAAASLRLRSAILPLLESDPTLADATWDLVLSTHPDLAEQARRLDAAARFCDDGEPALAGFRLVGRQEANPPSLPGVDLALLRRLAEEARERADRTISDRRRAVVPHLGRFDAAARAAARAAGIIVRDHRTDTDPAADLDAALPLAYDHTPLDHLTRTVARADFALALAGSPRDRAWLAATSMALGLPVVTDPATAAQLHAADGRELLTAGDAGEMARAVRSLLDSPRRRYELSLAGRGLVQSRLSLGHAPWTASADLAPARGEQDPPVRRAA